MLQTKNKKAKEKNQSSVVDYGSNGDVLLVTTTDKPGATELFDSGCTYYMCPHGEWFFTYKPLDASVVLIGSDT